MKRFVAVVVFLVLFSLAAVADQHIVRFTNGVPADFSKTVTAMGGTVVSQHPVMAVVKGLSPAAVVTLGAIKGVAEVVADETFVLDDTMGAAETAVPASATNPAGAFFYPRQWNMRAIGADKAWAAGKLGSAGVTVAVIDSGVDYNHPEILGHVDLSRSTTFQTDESVLVQALFPGRNNVTDLLFHGTHVTNTIVSNAAAIAGVTSQTTIIGVKVLAVTFNPDGTPTGNASGSLSAVLNGVLWAADHGADVANMSLGGGFGKAGNGRFIGLINSTFNYASRKGTLVVVSAGNAGSDLDHNGNTLSTYCNAPNVVCVAATGPTAQAGTNGPWLNIDAPAYYTNFGRSAIDVAAPGGNNSTFVYQACSQTSIIVPVCSTGLFVIGAQGTSMASPHVSGLAALLVAQLGHGNPSLIKARIEQGADDLGQVGTDQFYGKGRINVPKSLGIK
jgi:lantibiotic leader peptide-processing serine protease